MVKDLCRVRRATLVSRALARTEGATRLSADAVGSDIRASELGFVIPEYGLREYALRTQRPADGQWPRSGFVVGAPCAYFTPHLSSITALVT